MRDQHTIEQEIDDTREDLEHNLTGLVEAVREKVDIKGKAKRAVDERRQQLADFFEQARIKVASAYNRTIEIARDRPVLVAGVLGAIIAIGGGVGYFIYSRRRSS